MDNFENLYNLLAQFVPLLSVITGLTLTVLITSRILNKKRSKLTDKSRFSHQMSMLLIFAIGIIALILALPTSESLRGQLLGLIGVVFTAIIALSSTTFVANIMAGLMLRSVGSFHPGDFIRVGDFFGRVTERDLFHIEIQTEDRDLMTIPNMYLISQPVSVISATGTIVSCQLSLGYDLPHEKIETLLISAAKNTGLQDPFVQIMSLGDFSVTYRVAGFLEEARQILSMRSKLQKEILLSLHGAEIEIVSPSFMNQRQLNAETKIIPKPSADQSMSFQTSEGTSQHITPEEIMFEKADAAEKLDKLKARHKELLEELSNKEQKLATLTENDQLVLKNEITAMHSELDALSTILKHNEQQDTKK
ncbi:MAG TPA: mechanosensitive ion channel domain-containing protein [Pseudomonadales bacterium]